MPDEPQRRDTCPGCGRERRELVITPGNFYCPSCRIAGPCFCGRPGCEELGWPHEWDPSTDTCVLGHDGHGVDTMAAEPPVRIGSGYACAACARPVAEPV